MTNCFFLLMIKPQFCILLLMRPFASLEATVIAKRRMTSACLEFRGENMVNNSINIVEGIVFKNNSTTLQCKLWNLELVSGSQGGWLTMRWPWILTILSKKTSMCLAKRRQDMPVLLERVSTSALSTCLAYYYWYCSRLFFGKVWFKKCSVRKAKIVNAALFRPTSTDYQSLRRVGLVTCVKSNLVPDISRMCQTESGILHIADHSSHSHALHKRIFVTCLRRDWIEISVNVFLVVCSVWSWVHQCKWGRVLSLQTRCVNSLLESSTSNSCQWTWRENKEIKMYIFFS